METVGPFEISVYTYKTIQCYAPEDSTVSVFA